MQVRTRKAKFHSSNPARLARSSPFYGGPSLSSFPIQEQQREQNNIAHSELGANFNFGNIPVFSPSAPTIQPKLTIGQPNDKYEQEADRVADQVMQFPDTQIVGGRPTGNVIQRTCATCSNEYHAAAGQDRVVDRDNLYSQCGIQAQPLVRQISPLLQREVDNVAEQGDEEKTVLQTKPLFQRQSDENENEKNQQTLQASGLTDQTPTVSLSVTAGISAMQGGGQALSPAIRGFMEPRFGHDFSQVRIHSDSNAVKTSQHINARAFTVGQNIAFGAGQYQPNNSTGRKLLAHELTHVIQQRKSSPSQGSTITNGQGSTTFDTGSVNTTVQRKVTVENPKVKIPRPGGKGLDQTNRVTVQNYLTKLCSSGAARVNSSGSVDIAKSFCTPKIITIGFGTVPFPSKAALSKTPTGCGCLCDLVHSSNSWKIKVDDASWPHTILDDRAAADGKKPGGTGGIVTTPSPNSPKLWGAATSKGKALDIDPWLVLGHELCGHAWLGNFGKHAPDSAKPRGEGGHQETIRRENKLRAEHGIDLRGTFKDPNCGESYWREKKKPGTIKWSSYRDVCKNWRKEYNKKNKTKYKISDRIP